MTSLSPRCRLDGKTVSSSIIVANRRKQAKESRQPLPRPRSPHCVERLDHSVADNAATGRGYLGDKRPAYGLPRGGGGGWPGKEGSGKFQRIESQKSSVANTSTAHAHAARASDLRNRAVDGKSPLVPRPCSIDSRNQPASPRSVAIGEPAGDST